MSTENEVFEEASPENEGGSVAEFRRDETEFVLKEMFARVGAEYTPDYVTEPDWYLRHTWTVKEAAEFTTWLANFLKRRHKGVGKKKSQAEAQWFVLNVGWKQTAQIPNAEQGE